MLTTRPWRHRPSVCWAAGLFCLAAPVAGNCRGDLLHASSAPASSAPAPDIGVSPAFVTEIAKGEFVRVGQMEDATATNLDGIANTGFIVGSECVAVIDPGGSLADGQLLRAAIKARTALPVCYVIMTHDHPDHVFGGGAFSGGHAVFVGSWRLAAGMADRAAYDHDRLAAILGNGRTGMPVPPSMPVKSTATLDLGGRRLLLQAQAIAHSGDDLTVFDTATATLWTGDLVFSGRVPALDGSLTGWLRVLGQLEAVPAKRAVPGHGPASLPWPQGDEDERRYLGVLQRDVLAAIAAGRDIDTTVATAGLSERGKWSLFDAYNGRNVTEAYKELQWQ